MEDAVYATGGRNQYAMLYLNVARHESEFKGIIDDIPVEPPGKVLKWVLEEVGLEKIGKFICITWATWTCRNKKVLGGEEINIQILVHAFLKMLQDYQSYAS